MLQTLHIAGRSLVMTIPDTFVEANQLHDDSPVELSLLGARMTVEVSAPRTRYKLADLLAEMPDGLPRVDGWDEMASVGQELD